jgi:hypothetical protein
MSTGTGSDGIVTKLVKITGSASYDTGGSVLDLSDYFGDEVRTIMGQAQGTGALGVQYVPAASNAPATGKLVLFDKDGTQESSTDNMSTTTYDLIAVGTDA